YSIVRAILSIYLLIHFIRLSPQTPNLAMALPAVGAIASVLLAIGFRPRIATLAIIVALSDQFGLTGSLWPVLLACALAAHAALPSAPFWSWDARGRVDPRGGWHFPDAILVASWFVMGAGYAYGDSWFE